jgi:hypothetical protein
MYIACTRVCSQGRHQVHACTTASTLCSRVWCGCHCCPACVRACVRACVPHVQLACCSHGCACDLLAMRRAMLARVAGQPSSLGLHCSCCSAVSTCGRVSHRVSSLTTMIVCTYIAKGRSLAGVSVRACGAPASPAQHAVHGLCSFRMPHSSCCVEHLAGRGGCCVLCCCCCCCCCCWRGPARMLAACRRPCFSLLELQPAASECAPGCSLRVCSWPACFTHRERGGSIALQAMARPAWRAALLPRLVPCCAAVGLLMRVPMRGVCCEEDKVGGGQS